MNTVTNSKTTNPLKKIEKIPQVKHFYDSEAAKKAKQLTKKAMNSRFVKSAMGKSSARKGNGESADLMKRVADAPIAVQLGALAVVAAGSYMLWKNREKIQGFIKETGDSVMNGISKGAQFVRSDDETTENAH